MSKSRKGNLLKILIFQLSMILGITGCAQSNDKGFKGKLDSSANETCLDEVIESIDSDILEKVSKIEDYIELSDRLSKHKLPLTYVPIDELNKSTLLEIPEIEELFKEVSDIKESDVDYEKKIYLAIVQTKLLNKYILEEGYKISSDLALLTLKSKIADMYGLPKDLAIDLTKTITIPSYVDYTNNNSNPENWDTYVLVGDKFVVLPRELRSLLEKIYLLQENIGRGKNYNYNKDRNNLIYGSFEQTANVLPKSFKLKFK